uniref:Uncharacterized protein n=1 Tax=Oryzias melastigma TaxID=30732 RepID=A0A3B3BIF2_ORYME
SVGSGKSWRKWLVNKEKTGGNLMEKYVQGGGVNGEVCAHVCACVKVCENVCCLSFELKSIGEVCDLYSCPLLQYLCHRKCVSLSGMILNICTSCQFYRS